MGLNLEYIYGQIPLEEEEKDEILIPTISTRAELDEFEQKNIEDAIQWILVKSLDIHAIFSQNFVLELHRRMFGSVWSWAGEFRKTNKNLGVDKWQISTELKTLTDDAVFWIKNEEFPQDEIAVRYKHRLVSIHCFPNGNGRHSRLMADVIVDKVFNRKVFSWGSGSLMKKGEARSTYLKALKEADQGNLSPLLTFARS